MDKGIGWVIGIAVVVLVALGFVISNSGDEQEVAPEPEVKLIAQVDGGRIANADSEPENWLAHGRTYSEQRFSPLSQINTGTVGGLGLAWEYATGTIRGLEATPIVVDGMMFTTGTWSRVYALDAKTGAELWTYDPQVPGEWARNACCDIVNRGVAVWNGRVYFATLDGRLIALDAKSGALAWEVSTIDKARPYTITQAPRIVKGNVIIGNGGAEYGVRGYFTAYDAETGKQKWRFFVVPGDPSKPTEHPEMDVAMPTWSTGDSDLKWWEVGGGGTAWDSMAYDPELDLLYIGTGNGAPWNRHLRSPGGGDNLFLSSILALKPETGQMVWYYQTTPGENWDYTTTQHMILADLTIDGVDRKVIMQAPKNGFFYVLDRETGELLSAHQYAKVTWATHVDMTSGRPVEVPEQYYSDAPKEIFPGPGGAHNWHPMAFNPGTGLVYIPVHDNSFVYNHDPEYEYINGNWNTGNSFAVLAAVIDQLGIDPEVNLGKGTLKAWNPLTGEPRWVIRHPTLVNGGLLTTAGNLVFQGTGDGRFLVIHAETGEVLKEINVGTGIIAPPMTYAIDGEQYIAVMAGYGGGGHASTYDPKVALHTYNNDGRILVFKLGGAPEVPLPEPSDRGEVPEPPALEADEETLLAGRALFHRQCAICHGFMAAGHQTMPDLRYTISLVYDDFDEIVLGGARKDGGMASFADLMGPEETKIIRDYVVSEAWRAFLKQEEAKKAAATP